MSQEMQVARFLHTNAFSPPGEFFELKARDVAKVVEETALEHPILSNDKTALTLMLFMEYAWVGDYSVQATITDFRLRDSHRGLLSSNELYFRSDASFIEWVESVAHLRIGLVHPLKPSIEVSLPIFMASRIPFRLRGAANEVCQALLSVASSLKQAWWLSPTFKAMVHEQYLSNTRLSQRVGGIASVGSYRPNDLVNAASELSPLHVLLEGNGVHSVHFAAAISAKEEAVWNSKSELHDSWSMNEDEEAFCLHIFISPHYLNCFMRGKERKLGRIVNELLQR